MKHITNADNARGQDKVIRLINAPVPYIQKFNYKIDSTTEGQLGEKIKYLLRTAT